jgi:hypothetical protein
MRSRLHASFCTLVPLLTTSNGRMGDYHIDFIEVDGGRTRDRTLDLSRVKGTLSR